MRPRLVLLVVLGLLFAAGGCRQVPHSKSGEEPSQADPSPGELPQAGAAPAPETLVVFVQPDRSDLARRFEWQDLLEIEFLAAEEDVDLRIVDVAEGAPREVGLTPLIAFVHHRGRAIYQGRYLNQTRLRHFLRTFRRLKQGDEGLVLRDVPVRRWGRMAIAAPLKITALTGTPPAPALDLPAASLSTEARRAILQGLSEFEETAEITLGRSDRAFYMDFHPYRSPDGELFVSAELFSQFHCHEAIFSNATDPVVGRWEDRKQVFSSAAALLQAELLRQIENSDIGDGFDAVPKEVSERSWESLGLALPAAPSRSGRDSTGGSATSDQPLATLWALDQPERGQDPLLLFRFVPPLDHYAGEAREVRGGMEFDSERLTSGGCGIEVVVDSITMGHPDLDEYIRGDAMLRATQFPEASFVADSLECDPLRYGVPSRGTLQGSFTMKGVSQPMEVGVLLEPIVSETGEQRLIMTGSFRIRLRELYGMEGPDGPSPARDTLWFDFRFPFQPGEGPPRTP